jgi:ribonuclease-3
MDAGALPREVAELEARLEHVFRRPEWLAAAVTHRSRAAEEGPAGPAGNQRLEFLGDAVLGAITAEWLVVRRPEWREGTLTKVRSRLTNAATLARVARKMELGAWLRLGRGEELAGGRDKSALLADALEALLGALWLDGGPEPVRRVFARWFDEEIAAALEAGADENPKGELQERMQRSFKASPRYEVLEEGGPSHAPHFKMAVFHGMERLGEGTGASKREAETNAARHALQRLDAHESPPTQSP